MGVSRSSFPGPVWEPGDSVWFAIHHLDGTWHGGAGIVEFEWLGIELMVKILTVDGVTVNACPEIGDMVVAR